MPQSLAGDFLRDRIYFQHGFLQLVSDVLLNSQIKVTLLAAGEVGVGWPVVLDVLDASRS